MIPKYKQRSYILDQLHKGFVCCCIATTISAAVILVARGYNYYRYVRPVLKEMKIAADEQLLEEGKYSATE